MTLAFSVTDISYMTIQKNSLRHTIIIRHSSVESSMQEDEIKEHLKLTLQEIENSKMKTNV